MRGRVELFEAIRRDHRREGLSIRALASRHGVHRRTVREALKSPAPPPRRAAEKVAPVLDEFKPVIEAILAADALAPRKQRHTARRIWQRLVAEHGAQVSEATVGRYVRRRKAELGAGGVEVVVVQEHAAGVDAEVDFGEFFAVIAGTMTKCQLFVLRLSRSGKAVHVASTSAGQEAFLEGHVHAFTTLGGVPERIKYDNLKSAVVRVLQGRGRLEADRFIELRSHYGFDSFFCRPGVEGAHEKGGVEGEIGRFRRRHLVPVPEVESIAELNAFLARAGSLDDARHLPGRARSIGAEFAQEQPVLRPLPATAFEAGITLFPRVDRHSRITVRCHQYSVPARLVGRQVRVLLRAHEVIVYAAAPGAAGSSARVEVARHERSPRKHGMTLVLDHYLEVLARKPGALPGATALAQARRSGAFTSAHEAFWAAARAALGDTDGTRELVEVLLLHRHLPAGHVVAGLNAATTVGAVRADVVAVEARRIAQDSGAATLPAAQAAVAAGRAEPSVADLSERVVARLTERRLGDPAAVIAGLPPDNRPLPSVEHYDELLILTRKRAAAAAAAQAAPTSKGQVS